MDNNELINFQRSLASNGLIGYSHSDLQYLFNIARICARTAGVPLGGAGAVMGAGAGSVTLPGIGAVPGFVAGALAGFIGGTASCMVARGALKKNLDEILKMK